MRFYVSGPVVQEPTEKDKLGHVYLLIKGHLQGHQVHLPIRSADLDGLKARDFYEAVFKMIKSCDGVITVLTEGDQSGPVESTISSMLGKPQCLIAFSKATPRLLAGLPHVLEVISLESGDLTKNVTGAIERFLKSVSGRQATLEAG